MPTTSVSFALDHFTTFGDLLKYLRRRTGQTQRELSIAVGYSDTQISRLEQNERLPDLATLTARFLPALHIENQPEIAKRLLELAATVRREDAPAVGFPPYKGLHYFEETDAELFFGREALTGQLLNRLMERVNSEQRFLAIIGASGSGKSSVVRAGLIPALHWQQSSSGWPVFVITPTAHPLDTLALALLRETRQNSSVRKYVDELAHQPEALHAFLKPIIQSGEPHHCILIVDQFEELFTLCRSETEQTAFVANLLTAALKPGGRALIVIVLRADFYAHCARYDTLRQALAQHQEYIGPLTNEELRCAIEEPAQHGHWELEPGLVDLLLHDVGGDVGHTPEPGALPLLSHALLATWQRRRGRTMTLSGYTASGGVRGAIAETAEAVFYDHLDPEQRDVARQIFLRLTALGGDASTADTRRRVQLTELVSKPEDREMVHEVLLTLADARLITTDQDTAEVAHEALIREWPTLRGWLEDDREGLRIHRRLTEAAQEWDAMGRDPEVLYRGARLAQAVEWADSHPGEVNMLEHAFLETSKALLEKDNIEREMQRQRELETVRQLAETERARAEEQSSATQRLRQRAILLTLALMIAGIMAIASFFLWQRGVQANHLANSRELAAAAINNLEIDPERSVLLALHALEEADTLEARNALHQAIPELHILRTIAAHQQTPGVSFSPDGNRLASIGAVDGVAKVWDALTGQEQLILPGDPGDYGHTVAFSPDGTLLATAFSTKVIVWDAFTGQKRFSLPGVLAGTISRISFSPDGKRLAVANMDGVPKVWDLSTRTEVFALIGHEQLCEGIAYSPDGRKLATGDMAGVIKIWDAKSGKGLLTLRQNGVIRSVAFSPDSTRLASANEDGSLRVWDANTGKELLSLRYKSGLYDVIFMPDGTRLVSAHQDGTTQIWDSVSGHSLLTLAGHVSTVVSIVASPDGQWVATGGYDGTVKIWEVSPGKELLTWATHDNQVWDVAYTPDGTRLGTVSLDGTAKLWDSIGQMTLFTPSEISGGLTSLAFSPDGQYMAAGSWNGMVTIWDIDTGQIETTLVGHTDIIQSVAFSPDGQHLATSSWDHSAKVWDIATGEMITIFSSSGAAGSTGLVFSPDGKSIFTGVDVTSVIQWDSTTGQALKTFPGGELEVWGVAISPDGKLAMGLQDGSIIVWDVATGQKLHTLSGHAGLILRLVFSRDGTLLATASFDGFAKVWDVSTGQELMTLYGNTSNVFGVSFSPDGTRLATAGGDGMVRIYTLQLDELVTIARDRLTRDLSEQECQKFLHVQNCP